MSTPPILRPSGVALTGRTVIYVSVGNRPASYYPILTELQALIGAGQLVTGATLFGDGDHDSVSARVETYYRRLGQLLDAAPDPGGLLVVLPADDGTIGVSAWNTIVIAQSRRAPVVVVSNSNHLRHLDQVTLELLPVRRSYLERTRAWAKFRWHPATSTSRLEWAMVPKDGRPSAPDSDIADTLATREAAIRASAKSPQALTRALASLQRGQAAKEAAAKAREEALQRGAAESAARADAQLASAQVMAQPLANWMTENEREAQSPPKSQSSPPKEKASGGATPKKTSTPGEPKPQPPPGGPPPPDGIPWSAGELKALLAAKSGRRRHGVVAQLLKGRAAKAAAELAKTQALAAGLDKAEADRAGLKASVSVMSRPTAEFVPDRQTSEIL